MARTWMESKIGPKMDHSCGFMPINMTSAEEDSPSSVISVGGWNNDVYSQTEIFDPKKHTWHIVTLDNSTKSLPTNIRSSVMIELNRRPFLVGGVSCTKTLSGAKKCEKLASGLAFETVDTDDISEVHGEWTPALEVMKIARSSHTVIHAPVTYFHDCILN
jgi:hypothetical protein